jgi:hypothetical protein
MKLTCLFSNAALARLALAVLLFLFATTSSARASVEQPVVVAVAAAPAAAGQTGLSPLVAALLGDRQRIVQIAMVVMGVAILILVCGNRF